MPFFDKLGEDGYPEEPCCIVVVLTWLAGRSDEEPARGEFVDVLKGDIELRDTSVVVVFRGKAALVRTDGQGML